MIRFPVNSVAITLNTVFNGYCIYPKYSDRQLVHTGYPVDQTAEHGLALNPL